MTIDTALFLLGLDTVSLPMPIVVSDFKNGYYSIGGVSKTFSQMWEHNADWAPFDPATVVAGQGLQVVSANGVDVFGGPASTAALFAALTREFIGVADYTFTTTGDPTLGGATVTVDVTDLPGYTEGWQWSFQPEVPYEWDRIFDEGIYDATQSLPIPQGHYKSAYMFCEEGLFSSINGLPAITGIGTPQANLAANTVGAYVDVLAPPGKTATVTLHSLTFYAAEQPSSILQLLSAL